MTCRSAAQPPEPAPTGFPRATWRTTARPAIAQPGHQAPPAGNAAADRRGAGALHHAELPASEGEPMAVRRAKMLLHLVRAMSITIDEDELIVGNRSLLPRMGVIAPEGAVDMGGPRAGHPAHAPAGSLQHHARADSTSCAQEIFPYWRGKTLEDIVATPRAARHHAAPCAARPSRSTRPTTPRATSCPTWRAGCAWASAGCAPRCRQRAAARRCRRAAQADLLRCRRDRPAGRPGIDRSAMPTWRRQWRSSDRSTSGRPS